MAITMHRYFPRIFTACINCGGLFYGTGPYRLNDKTGKVIFGAAIGMVGVYLIEHGGFRCTLLCVIFVGGTYRIITRVPGIWSILAKVSKMGNQSVEMGLIFAVFAIGKSGLIA